MIKAVREKREREEREKLRKFKPLRQPLPCKVYATPAEAIKTTDLRVE